MKEITALAEKLAPKLIELRQALHAHPELAWKEVETSKLIEKKLTELGFTNIRRGFKGTQSGVIADLKGAAPGSCVALRADIDALPIQEANKLPYVSTAAGVMHACGHDAHIAMLLGAAEILAAQKKQLAGTVRLIFQPAEEAGNDSGAPAMIREGALDGVAAIAGLHIWAPLPAGFFGWRKGTLMASADMWDMTIQGRGGHGSAPHNAVDPTVAVAHIISMLQTVVSREMDPLESVVVSVGKVESGSAPNVIPDKALVTGSVRTTSREIRSGMEARIRRIIDGVCSALRCENKFNYLQIYPVTVNEPALTDLMCSVAKDVLGADKLKELPVIMGSEDFSYYGEKIPATYAVLGMGDPGKGSDQQHHSPRFNVNDEVLGQGVSLLAGFALRYLAGKA